jgi:pimeloyl-ACP methyl ester carboxylesterase
MLGTALILIMALFIIFITAMWLVPLHLDRLISTPNRAANYDEAVARIAKLQAADAAIVDPVCEVQLMTHGAKTKKVIVFLHGYTNCPRQFVPLGQMFFDAGYNVFIPRMPGMGFADKLAPAQGDFTAEDLVKWGDSAIDIAQAFGDEVIVAGISGGANLAAWMAHFRPDVKRVVLIAPLFGEKQVPAVLTRPVVAALITLPNGFHWWDGKRKMQRLGPVYGYPRFATRPLGELIRLAFAVEAAAQQGPPTASSILVITNASDPAVNVERINTFMDYWRKYMQPQSYEFDASHKLIHDIIDPNQVEQQTNLVYPILFKLITDESASG